VEFIHILRKVLTQSEVNDLAKNKQVRVVAEENEEASKEESEDAE
jgi:preprotein translocase subunit Sec63